LIDDQLAATYRFRDEPRSDGKTFIEHLRPKHHFGKVMLVSGDWESEVRHLAEQVGIPDVHYSQSPEQKVEIVRREAQNENTIFIGDGIKDAPALMTATVGLAFGQNSDVTSEASDAVIMDTSLKKVDEFLHINTRMRVLHCKAPSVAWRRAFWGCWLRPPDICRPLPVQFPRRSSMSWQCLTLCGLRFHRKACPNTNHNAAEHLKRKKRFANHEIRSSKPALLTNSFQESRKPYDNA
jgi:soluble P-type ATPase